MKKNNIGYAINHTANTIVMTKAFAKQANIYGTPEYKVLVGLLHDFEGYTPTIKTISRSNSKQSYKGLTYENMKTYIQTADPNSYEEFLHVQKLSEIQSGSYAYVKTWFLGKYPNYADATNAKTTDTSSNLPMAV